MSYILNDTCIKWLEFEKAWAEYDAQASDRRGRFGEAEGLEERYGYFYDFPKELIEKFKKESCFDFYNQTKNDQAADIEELLMFNVDTTFSDEKGDVYEYFLRNSKVEKRIIWNEEAREEIVYIQRNLR